jgi:hypothetical protein
MTISMVQREAFASLGTLDSDTPGELGTVDAGSHEKRPVGPRLTADTSRGWSSIPRARSHWTIPAAASATDATYQYMVELWVYVDSLNLDTTEDRWINLINVVSQGGVSNFQVAIRASDGKILHNTNDGFGVSGYPGQLVGDVFPLRQWVQLRLAFQMRGAGFYTYDMQVLYRVLGGEWVKTLDWNRDSGFDGYTTFVDNYNIFIENQGNGGIAYLRGRYGMPGLYKTTSAADALLETPGVVSPDGLPTTWYLAAGGSDSATGLTGDPWETPTKLDDEINSEGGILSGDTIQLDGVAWDNRGVTVPLVLDGLTFNFRNNPPVFTKDISAPGTTWALESGKSSVYSTTNGSATDIAGCVVTENGVLLDKLDVADYANSAALLTALDSLPGTMWEDGSKVYVNTINSSSPATNGHTFLRSKKLTDRDSNGGASAILTHAPGTIDGGGLLFDMIGEAASSGGTGQQTFITRLSYASGTYTFRNAIVRGWTKHAAPCLANAGDTDFVTENITDLGGLPFGGVGAATNLVDYAGADGLTGCTSTYTHVNVAGVALKPGGGVYTSFNQFQVYYTHQGGTGSNNGFTSVTFTNCRFPIDAPLAIQYPVTEATFTRCRMAAPSINDDVPVTYVSMRPAVSEGAVVGYVPSAQASNAASGLGQGLGL